MLTKVLINDTINQFPDRFTADELIEKILFLDKLDRSNLQSENGEVISEIDLNTEVEGWFE